RPRGARRRELLARALVGLPRPPRPGGPQRGGGRAHAVVPQHAVDAPGARAHGLTVDEHLRIVEALERRDGGGARREMADHLLRGTTLEERSASLLEWWRARDVRAADGRARKAGTSANRHRRAAP